MKTKLIYLSDSYQKTATAKITVVDTSGNQPFISLDQSIFYAQGGGQPADTGTITGENGQLTVTHVSYNGGELQHKGKLVGELKVGDTVELEIDWSRRYTHMQLHTAGHILDQAVKNAVPGIKGIDGDHGLSKKSFVLFDQTITETDLPVIQKELDSIRALNLPITAEMVTHQDLADRNISLPFDLPKNKELRIVQIGEYPAMPDGGTQLHTTGECQPITVTGVKQVDGEKGQSWQVFYTVGAVGAAAATRTETADVTSTPDDFQTAIQLFIDRCQAAATPAGLVASFKMLTGQLKSVPKDQKPAAGKLLNQAKATMEARMTELNRADGITVAWQDLTMPGTKPDVGHLHPVSQAMEEISHIFEQIGFTRVRYPEVDWDWYVFESLNMPPSHPARDEWETFWVDVPPNKEKGTVVLTTHTSNGQVREMERLKSKPPIRMINIARCYRRQQDATHTQMFHQFEGLVVDKGITIQHLKGTLDYFAKEFYGEGVKSRIRPFHFQFTEPSFEVDFSCTVCEGTGKIKGDKCKFCKSGWHEVGGAGMVHPNVLKA
ncbi:hypothetical protein KBC79_02970, partial [Candidatus Woesebacteria bacterium]|nr:hypothetical protein [Candidatus Woesebacteria bacterium]